MQALNILDKTARAADPQEADECLSLADFLSELGDSESEGYRSRTESKVSLSGEQSEGYRSRTQSKVSLSGEHSKVWAATMLHNVVTVHSCFCSMTKQAFLLQQILSLQMKQRLSVLMIQR